MLTENDDVAIGEFRVWYPNSTLHAKVTAHTYLAIFLHQHPVDGSVRCHSPAHLHAREMKRRPLNREAVAASGQRPVSGDAQLPKNSDRTIGLWGS